MDWFQTVTDVGKGSTYDHAHGVIKVRPLHLIFDVDSNVITVAAVAAGWRKLTLWWKFLIGQRLFLFIGLIFILQ